MQWQLRSFWNSGWLESLDRKSTRLNSSHLVISYAVFCLKKKKKKKHKTTKQQRPTRTYVTRLPYVQQSAIARLRRSFVDRSSSHPHFCFFFFFFFNDTAPTDIYPLPLHAALPD